MHTRKLYPLITTLIVLSISLGCMGTSRTTPKPTLVPTSTAVPTSLSPITAPSGTLIELQTQVENVSQAVQNSVVNITVSSTSYDFFMNPVPQEGSGTGFVYDDQGHIVTNYHVIENADQVTVNLPNGALQQATIVGTDPTNDLAVIQIDPTDLELIPIPLADSTRLRVGQFVVAIGNPFGLQHTVTFGIISSLGRIIDSPDGRYIGEAIQTDAAINPGNSGGPLLDLEGRVIGVNSQIVSTSQDNAGIGFAIPVNTVRRVVPELISQGRYRHPWMGLQFFASGLTPQLAKDLESYGAPTTPDHGILILGVERGSAAANAGLRGGQKNIRVGRSQLPVGGDVITAINDVTMNEPSTLMAYLEANTQVGDTIQVTIIRDGETLTIPVTLQERPQ